MTKPPTYLLRWKGQQSGPFTKEAIEQKLRDGEISLAHEVCVDNKWHSLRGFVNSQAQAQEQERQQIRLRRTQNSLSQKEQELENAKTLVEQTRIQLEEAKRQVPSSYLQQQPPPSDTPGGPAAGSRSNNPIDKLKAQFRRRR